MWCHCCRHVHVLVCTLILCGTIAKQISNDQQQQIFVPLNSLKNKQAKNKKKKNSLIKHQEKLNDDATNQLLPQGHQYHCHHTDNLQAKQHQTNLKNLTNLPVINDLNGTKKNKIKKNFFFCKRKHYF